MHVCDVAVVDKSLVWQVVQVEILFLMCSHLLAISLLIFNAAKIKIDSELITVEFELTVSTLKSLTYIIFIPQKNKQSLISVY